MALTLTGDGAITGLAVGGLPDLSVGTADIADAAVTAAKMSGAQSGDAPIYAARAWVNFNGSGVVAIRASGNVTSITDRALGQYTVNFTTAMPDANYVSTGSHSSVGNDISCTFFGNASYGGVNSTTASTLNTIIGGGFTDPTYVYAVFFR